MGRGRAKAKQTKVARDLKYRPVNTDLSSLERELRGGDTGFGAGFGASRSSVSHEPEEIDPYEELAGKYAVDDDDEDDDESPFQRRTS